MTFVTYSPTPTGSEAEQDMRRPNIRPPRDTTGSEQRPAGENDRRLPAASEPADERVAPPGPSRASAPLKLAALLLVIAGFAVLSPELAIARPGSRLPMLLAGGALLAAGLLILAPVVRPLLPGSLRPALLAYVVAAGAAMGGLSMLPTPPVLIHILPYLLVALAPAILPANILAAPLTAAAVMGTVASLHGVSDPPPTLIGTLAVAFVLSAVVLRSRRQQQRLERNAAQLQAELDRARTRQSAMRDPNEMAAAVMTAVSGFASAVDPQEISDQIASATRTQLRSAATILLAWDETQDTFRVGAIAAAQNLGATDLKLVEIRPDSIPLLADNKPGEVIRLDPESFREPLLQSILRRARVHEIAAVRLQRGERLLGLLYVARADRQPAFSRRDRRILEGIAVHAAPALAHARVISDLQGANQLKEEFMATMSHELRTPLNVIIGYTDLQIDGAFGDLAEDQLDAVQRTRQQALQLLEIIQATLDMSRLERGLMSVTIQDVQVPDLIEDLKKDVPAAWRRSTVDLNWHVNRGLVPIRTDPAKLRIILRNLVHNALKFTSHGVVNVSVSANPGKERITFVVQDSGIGIRAEHLSGIFEMFRQIPQTDSVPGGVGLGLYIVKRLAAVLGAEIEVSSAPGRGTTFRIHLPVSGPLATRK